MLANRWSPSRSFPPLPRPGHLVLVVAFALVALVPGSVAAAGAAPGDGGPATAATLEWPAGLAIDGAGHLYVADRRGDRVRRVDAETGVITTYAGTGERGFDGDGGPAAAARLSIPESLAVDAAGHLYIADRGNARVRRVDAGTGVITTVAGNGEPGYDGDGGPATAAAISYPFGVAVDAAGNLYVADTENHAVRRVDAETGVITTVAGSGEAGFSGDGGPATAATLRRPHVVTLDPGGDLVIGDSFNQRIRRVDLESGRIETLYGSGEKGASEDGVDATQASFLYFGALLYDAAGDLWLTGWGDRRLRRIDGESGVVVTVAGSGEARSSGDGGPAREAAIHGPYGLAMDAAGNLYVAEAEAGRVRRVDAETGTITTVVGPPTGQ